MVNIKYYTETVTDRAGRKKKVLRFETGKNIKDRVIKRSYLNKGEHNQLFTLLGVVKLIEGEAGYGSPSRVSMWDEWSKKGMLTKEQVKNLKMANTYLGKFLSSVINDNLDVTEKDNIISKSRKFDFRLIDDYTLQKIQKMISETKGIFVEKDICEEMICDRMAEICQNCTKERTNCKFRKFLSDNFIPPFNEITPGTELQCNCEYSYVLK